MATTLNFVQSDTLPQIKLTLTDEITEEVIDLSGASVSLHAKPQAGIGVSFTRPAIFIESTDRPNGIAYIQWQDGDLNRAPGKYTAEVEIVYPNGGRQTVFETIILDIREDIGDIGTLPIIPTSGGAPNQGTVDITPATFTNASVGNFYTVTVTGIGAGQPYLYSITSGNLPSGITLTQEGVLSGTPTVAGTFTFTITADNTEEYVGARKYNLVVVP